MLKGQAMAKKKIAEYISEWMDAFGSENGYELQRTEFVKEGSDWYLRVYVDKLEDGEYVSMDTGDCEKISRFLSDKLDEEDPISQNYYLEVSSPGLDRLLVTENDFRRFTGSEVELRLYKAENGKKQFSGILEAYDGSSVVIDTGKEKLTFSMDKISKINLAVIF